MAAYLAVCLAEKMVLLKAGPRAAKKVDSTVTTWAAYLVEQRVASRVELKEPQMVSSLVESRA